MLWIKLKEWALILDLYVQKLLDVLDKVNSYIFFWRNFPEPIPPIAVDFFYEGYRLPWLGVFTAFFIVHILLFNLGNADPILNTLSVNLCKREWFVSQPTCLNSVSSFHVATTVDAYQSSAEFDLYDATEYFSFGDVKWIYFSLGGALIVGMANTKFHNPWWIFLGIVIECGVFYTYLQDMFYCPRFNGSFIYENTFKSNFYRNNSIARNGANTTNYGEYDWYTRTDALEFYEMPQCPSVENLKIAFRNIYEATLQVTNCLCELYPGCCDLVQTFNGTSLISAYYCILNFNGTLPEEFFIAQNIIAYGLSYELTEEIRLYEELGLLNNNEYLADEIQVGFDVMLNLGNLLNSLSVSEIETCAEEQMASAVYKGGEALACLCKLYEECCAIGQTNVTYPVYDDEVEAVVMLTTEMNVAVLERWNCSDLCLASALKSKHDGLRFMPWQYWYNRLFFGMVIIRFLMIIVLFLLLSDKLFRILVRCICKKVCWKTEERRKKIEWVRNFHILKLQPISSRFMTSLLIVLVSVIYFHIISWYIVFFIIYCVTYEEIPTPFLGFTYSFTFNFGKNFEQWHWAVYLGGAVLLLFVNAVFFGVYWMLFVGYQMLKRDVRNVIKQSEGDDRFKETGGQQFMYTEAEKKEISNFHCEMYDLTMETTRSEQLKSLGNALEVHILKEMRHSGKRHSAYLKDGSYQVQQIFTKEEIQRYGYCTALKNMFFPFQDPNLENRTIYEDCMCVNPFLASAFPAIYIIFALTGLMLLLLIVLVGFIVLLFLILNLALVKPIFPPGYPLTKEWLWNTVIVTFLYIYLASLIANHYLMPREGEWIQRIKLYQWVVLLDLFYLLSWGILKAYGILTTIIVVDIVTWGFGRMAVWSSTLKPPFQLLDSKYSAYVAVVRAAMIAHHARKNPRILLTSTKVQRQNAISQDTQSLHRLSTFERTSTFANPLTLQSELEFQEIVKKTKKQTEL